MSSIRRIILCATLPSLAILGGPAGESRRLEAQQLQPAQRLQQPKSARPGQAGPTWRRQSSPNPPGNIGGLKPAQKFFPPQPQQPPIANPNGNNRRDRYHGGRGHGYRNRPSVGIYPHYQTNIIAPRGYGYDPRYGFVPYELGLAYGFGNYGYGYTYDGFSGVFGSGGLGSGIGVGGRFGGGFGGGLGAGVGPGLGFGGAALRPAIPSPAVPPLLAAPRTPRGFSGRQTQLVDTDLVPLPPLPTVNATLVNSNRREIIATLVDLRDSNQTRQIRIPAGGSVVVPVDRDAGAEKVSLYETYDSLGNPITREVSRPVRPEVIYEVVVHEVAMQSVAIDRTGTSPNVIEDVQMQGRGIGRFSIPPGRRFGGGRIDVYGAAKAADNAGSVEPIAPGLNGLDGNPTTPTDNASKLERAVFEAQQEAMRRQRAAK